MKKITFLLVAILANFNSFAQIVYEQGYFINNANQRTDCLIYNEDWKNNPTEFTYKIAENSEAKVGNINIVKEFGIGNSAKFVRSTVMIDRSTETLANMGFERDPSFKEEKLFLKVLVEGPATLYSYEDSNLRRYFYKTSEEEITQLIFKTYKVKYNKTAQNNRYKQQLLNNLKCEDISLKDIEKLGYEKQKLTDIFVKYNTCKNANFTNYNPQVKRDLFNLTIRPRANSQSLIIENSFAPERNTDFGTKTGFGIGLELEFVLGFNKNKWSVFTEPTYQNFSNEVTRDEPRISGDKLVSNIDYTSIEVPMGLRHYFFLNSKSKIFLNAAFVMDFGTSSKIIFKRANGSTLNELNIKSRNNLAFGAGYKYGNISMEIRYQTNREILGDYLYWNSEFNSASLIVGYSIL